MNIQRKLARVGVGISSAVLSVGAVLSLGMTASAATPSCASGRLCIWDGTNYDGTVVSMTLPGAGSCKTMPYSWAKNMMSSYYNNSSHAMYFYDGDNCTGSGLNTAFAHDAGSLAGSSVNNKANSFRVE
jgi:type IV secretory pathway TrbL component